MSRASKLNAHSWQIRHKDLYFLTKVLLCFHQTTCAFVTRRFCTGQIKVKNDYRNKVKSTVAPWLVRSTLERAVRFES